MKELQVKVVDARAALVLDITNGACVALQLGCFAAGTKMLTRAGWRAIELIAVGDEVASRAEGDLFGDVDWKAVEATFRRTACVAHLHADGQVIRTTLEHPFWADGKGWTAAGSLKQGDRIATLSGEWITVEELYDTGEWEPVYNLRVADWHTYFVGDEGWGWSAWAHNEYQQLFREGDDQRVQPIRNFFRSFEIAPGINAGGVNTPPDILIKVTEAKAITLRIINALRATMTNGFATLNTTGVAFVLVNGQVQLWVSQSSDGTGPIAADRRRALYQVLTQDSVVKSYLSANKITVVIGPNALAKQVLNPKTDLNLTLEDKAEVATYISTLKSASEYATVEDDQIPVAQRAKWRKEALKVLNHAERQIYRQLDQVSGARLLAIGSTIKMCLDCQTETVTRGLQYAIAVPTVSGYYVTTPAGWVEKAH